MIIALFLVTSIFSQNEFSLRMDFAKALFGAYQLEVEYEKNEKKSYGIGIIYFDYTSSILINDNSANQKAFGLSPFIRHYNKSNRESSSFYQGTLRYVNFTNFSPKSEGSRKSLIALDFVYGYQFKINNTLYLEPSIGIGALRNLDIENKFFLTPYPIVNFNASFKL